MLAGLDGDADTASQGALSGWYARARDQSFGWDSGISDHGLAYGNGLCVLSRKIVGEI